MLDLPGWRHIYSGKVRDLYVPAATSFGATQPLMLVVASDRVSAFDHLLEPGIPDKGRMLTTVSQWWFSQLAGADGGRPIPNHLASPELLTDRAEVTVVPDEIASRAMVVTALKMEPIECVVRGYITGTGWAEYRESQTVCGIKLPHGLNDGDRLPEPLFAPAYKAPAGEHDENISFERLIEIVGRRSAEELRETSLEIYHRAAATAEQRGLIIADTKMEFGRDADGVLALADEVLTSDSSRYWDADAWHTGRTATRRIVSFDKQIVRDWLVAKWDRAGEPPVLPPEIVNRTHTRYAELLDRLTSLDYAKPGSTDVDDAETLS